MRNVVIIDDNVLSVEGVFKSIDWQSLNLKVTYTFYDAQSIFNKVNLEDINIIISDISMPGMSGLEMSKKLLSRNAKIKIILISAYDNFEYAKDAVRIGAFDYIEKPLDYSYLYEIIQKANAEIMIEEKNLEQLKKSRNALIQNFYFELLHNSAEYSKYNLLDYIDYLQLDVDCNLVTSLIINLDNAQEIKSKFGIEQYHLSIMNLSNELIKNFSEFKLTYVLHERNDIILMIGDISTSKRKFNQSILDLIVTFTENYNKFLKFNIGIGIISDSIWNINECYETAKTALEYRFFFPQKYIFDIKDNLNNNYSPSFLSEEYGDKLIKFICKKDLKKIETLIFELAEKYKYTCSDKNTVFLLIYSILNKLLKLLYDIGIDSTGIQNEFIKIYNANSSFSNSYDIFNWLYELCIMICDDLDSSIESYQRKLCSQVVKYIQDNFTSPDLCLNDIASHVNVSSTHLSAMFKKIIGDNIVNVILQVRIDAAKKLLKTTNLSIKEISEKVGYSNQYYFSACFKKVSTYTPSTFRMTNLLSFT